MTTSSYPKVWNLGHPRLGDMLEREVVVQEKVDGSQFTFGVSKGKLVTLSKRTYLFEPSGLFAGAVQTAQRLYAEGLLGEGIIYRGEAMQKPRHNALAYGRIPVGHIALFDVEIRPEMRLLPRELEVEAARLGLEAVPTLHVGRVDVEQLRGYLTRESFLGGATIEGVVIKARAWGEDGKQLMGKLVREEFRELNKAAHAKPGRGDIIAQLSEMLASPARYAKAVQRLRESGELEGELRDIGRIMREVQEDIEAEAEHEVKDALWQAFRKDILRGATRGVPSWYKASIGLVSP